MRQLQFTARFLLTFCLQVLFVLAVSRPVAAFADTTSKPLVVGTVAAAPFAIHNADGSWSGVSIDLWKRVADDLKVPYVIREITIPEVDHLADSGIDVFVSRNISAHAVGASEMSHAFISAGLAIATRVEPKSGFFAIASKMLSKTFAGALAVLFVVLLLMGGVVWSIERHAKPDEFGGHPFKGIAHGTFWAFESVVGKAAGLSRTLSARIVTLLWSLVVTVVVSGLTAKLASELTVSQLNSSISGPNDLPRVKVGAIDGTTASRYLESRGVAWKSYPDGAAEIAGLVAGEVDAVVDEAPILKYQINKLPQPQALVLPGTFLNHGYGFAFPVGSPLVRTIDLEMLRVVEGGDWASNLAHYLGNAKE